MKNLLHTFIFGCTLVLSTVTWGQEQVLPITHNGELLSNANFKLKNSSTIDSTFIYTVDTLALPVFDDFSKNRIQQYSKDFNGSGVTSTLFYKLTDTLNNPLPMNAVYTTQQTFKKTFNTVTGETTNSNFPGTTIKVGDLTSYPVSYQTKVVYPAYYIFDTVGIPNTPDTIWIVGPDIAQTTARQFFAHAATPGKYWIDDYAYHNYRYAKDPWSIGVMTFDGIDNKGFPYQIGTTLSGVADYLTSKPIDLSSKNASDSLYLSFLYQAQGLGDKPETNDSLILEFYDVAAQKWRWQWSTKGTAVTDFKLAHIPVTNPAYFSNAFQFRFKNYGGLSGALDHFHLDYVHLRDQSGHQDTLIEDFAISYPTVSLLKDYTAVPWDHYKNNATGKMSTEVPLTVRNSYLNGGANISSTGGGKFVIKHNGATEGTVNLNGQRIVNYNPTTQPVPDYQPRTTYHSTHDASSFQFDPSKPGTQQRFTLETIVSVPVGSNYLPNDTAYSEQYFGNYYAYDDGSAEQAYGPTGPQARLAIKYKSYEPDSVIGAMIHFVPTVNDVTGKLFQLTIWGDNNGQPGAVLYEDDGFFLRQPEYGYGQNAFIHYYTKDTMKVAIHETFYIGWKQIDGMNLGVGLDRNTDAHVNTYYSNDFGATWAQSQFPGSVMIRPIFSTSMDAELGVKQVIKEDNSLVIYPNPSTGKFTVTNQQSNIGTIHVYSMLGELLMTTNETSFDLSEYPEGMYFIQSSNYLSKTYKVVKTK